MPIEIANSSLLSPPEHDSLDRPLRDLHRELRGLLATLPIEAQTASGLARYLRIERTTCQRAVSAATQPYAGLSLASQLPGPRGLRLLVDAVAKRRNGEPSPEVGARVASLRAAIDAYEAATRRTAGSRSELLRRLEAQAADAGDSAATGSDVRLREQLFHAAAGLTGRSSQTWLAAHIYEPQPGGQTLMQTRAHGLIGHVARDDAVPLTLHVIPPDAELLTPDALEPAGLVPLVPAPDDGAPAEVLRAFSTRPIPIVRTQHPNEFIVQTVERAPGQSETDAFDVLFAMRGRMVHPGHTPSRLEEVWALINFPVRRLLLDVFLHRDLARDCIPGLDTHLWRPDFAAHVGERWQTRFARGPKLQVLGAGLQHAGTESYARHRELLAFLFAARGMNPADYIGFRCETPYPMWRTGYRVTLDFGGPQ